MPSAAFKKATEDSRKIKAKPGNDELLEMYGLYKVANGEDISKSTQPGMFDLKGKAKFKAWQKEADAKTTPAAAEKKYIDLVESLKSKYGYDANKVPEALGERN
ncbi:hypothetical protein LTR10_021359 [Elasticomyces elasticus]|uniref:ACB domain-containing protein n=1 Tax=Exophiala sideris TaxID=1016849 RepID=A0ABR0JHR7_9EURO|nr:hypothetical protein LTR10_021359 [Elasticomyces elasticus]KAK5033420.1 hypothetical protein LTS07_003723 [Exophiala sideris]KAK5042084.1 hypothetical protein LTR13_001890 [Exophiala sideris]KAK5063964.1 hypothetical protein LTR69_003731 [Exophiala sideris]KAK5185352.1 hypothetical protein LTR44_002341 [Eurotiomycetes sp. CCFEE 6388]